jgi:hypothetical protein
VCVDELRAKDDASASYERPGDASSIPSALSEIKRPSWKTRKLMQAFRDDVACAFQGVAFE